MRIDRVDNFKLVGWIQVQPTHLVLVTATTDMNLCSPADVSRILRKHGLHPNKRLGQNFLCDRNILDRIITVADVGPSSRVLEIGPGLGTVTEGLIDAGARVVCVEIDNGMANFLTERLSSLSAARVIHADFLKVDLNELLCNGSDGEWMVVGNLPYYITTPIITRLIEHKGLFSSLVVMVQKEVAQRFAAEPGSENYGSISAFVNYHCTIERICLVSRNVFYPAPDVDSALVRLTMRRQPAVSVHDEALFFNIIRSAFGTRRKTLANALSGSSKLGWTREQTECLLAAAGIDKSRRGETLTLQEFGRLANAAGDE